MRRWLSQKRPSIMALLIYFILYLTAFTLLERFVQPRYYIHCALDDLIPFCKWALIPYVFWFIWIPFVILYLLWKDQEQFNRFYWATVLGSACALTIYALFPNGLQLRRVIYDRDFMSQMVLLLRRIDTPTNVCPSLHVYQSVCACIAVFRSKAMQRWRIFAVIAAVAISWSTMLLDQHSVIDVLCGVVLCLLVDCALTVVYRKKACSRNGLALTAYYNL